MIQAHCYLSFEAVQGGRGTVTEVVEERAAEAKYLYDNKQIFCRKDSVIRKYQEWPGHKASDHNELNPGRSRDWRGQFWIPYSMQDACRRLYDTIVMIDGLPYLVVGLTNRDGMSLILQDHVEKIYVASLSSLPSLRSPAPGYIPREGKAYFLHRNPMEHNKQGMSHENSFVVEAGHAGDRVAACGEQQALDGLHHRNKQDGQYLSPKLAIFMRDGTNKLEYMGRCIGEIEDRIHLTISRDEDRLNPWIAAAVKEAELEVV